MERSSAGVLKAGFAWALLLSWTSGCLAPGTIEWPLEARGQAVIVAEIRDGSRLVGPPLGSLADWPRHSTILESDELVVVEYQESYDELQLRPAFVAAEQVSYPSQLHPLASYQALGRPRAVWRRSGRSDAVFAADADPRLPLALGDSLARDLSCPVFEAELLEVPAPVRALLPIAGGALAVLVDGRHLFFDGTALTEVPAPGWTGPPAVGVTLATERWVLARLDGTIAVGEWVGGEARYRASIQLPGPAGDHIEAIAGAPDGDELVLSWNSGRVERLTNGTSSVAGSFLGADENASHQRLAWLGPGEAFGLWRRTRVEGRGVWRLSSVGGRPQFAIETFGESRLEVPNVLAFVEGRWLIAGSDLSTLEERQALYAAEGQRWTPVYPLLSRLRVENLLPWPSQEGAAFATRNGARIGVQPRLGRGRLCEAETYAPQLAADSDVTWLVPLPGERLAAALGNLEQLLILSPAGP